MIEKEIELTEEELKEVEKEALEYEGEEEMTNPFSLKWIDRIFLVGVIVILSIVVVAMIGAVIGFFN